jgi:hypothetical protein
MAALLFALAANEASSQKMLVNEIYFYGPQGPIVPPEGSTDPPYDGDLVQQWVELVTYEDVLELYNFKQNFDSASIKSSRGKFGLSYELRYLRSGTFIVVWMGTTAGTGFQLDLDSDDGYIEILGDEDNEIVWSGDNTLGQNNCSAQITDNVDNHIHALAYSSNPTFYSKLNSYYPFYAYCDKQINNQTSVAVVPGTALSDYNSPTKATAQNVMGSFITKGLPNQAPSAMNMNQLYLRKLRQPNWGTEPDQPQLNVVINGNSAVLTWPDVDDDKPDDNLTGYLVVRYLTKENESKKTPHPIDGQYYNAAEGLRTADTPPDGMEIIAHVDNSNITTVTDDDVPDLECGDEVIYRVYAYRFHPDQQGKDDKPENARGRSYNEDYYCEYVYHKPRPAKPWVGTEEDVNVICSGDSILIKTRVFGEAPDKFEWYLNDEVIPNESNDTLWAKEDGTYLLRYTDKYDCPIDSDPFVLTVLPPADVDLYTDNHLITQDTTIYFCGSGGIDVIATNPDNQLLLDKEVINEQQTTYTLDQPGVYEFVGYSSGACPDTSYFVEIVHRNIAFVLNPTSLDFGTLASTTPYAELTVDITNNSNEDLTFDTGDITITGDYSIESPAVPFPIAQGTTETLTIRFTPTKSGNGDGNIVFSNVCNISQQLDLTGEKEQANLLADRYDVPFEYLLVCSPDTETRIETVVLTNDGGAEIKVIEPTVPAPFSIEDASVFTNPIPAKQSISINFVFDTRAAGNYDEDIIIEYEAGGNTAELAPIKLTGDVFQTAFEFDNSEITFPDLTGCEESIDGTFEIENTGDVEITIEAPTATHAEFPNLPIPIAAGATETINITFRPQGTGAISETITFTENVCNETRDLQISGNKNSMSITYDPTEADFGNVYLCDANVTGEITVTLDLEGADEFTVKSISQFTETAFTTDLRQGDVLGEGGQFKVFFDANQPGTYTDELVVVYDPCDIEKRLPITLTVAENSYSTDSNPLGFGTTPIGVPVSETLMFNNLNDNPLEITQIRDIVAPFALTSHDANDFPLTVGPNSVEVFTFEFNPSAGIPYSKQIVFEIASPCAEDYPLILSGDGEATQDISVRGILPQNIMGSVNETKTVPIEIVSILSGDQLADAKLESVTLQMSYNETMLYPEAVSIGSALEAGVGQITLDNSQLGIVDINIEIADDQAITFGEFAKLDLLVLLGNELSTDLVLESAVFVAESTITMTEKEDGIFALDEDCEPESLLIEHINPPSIIVKGKNPFSEATVIEFNIESDDPADLVIFNSKGETVKVLAEQQAGAGTYTYPVDASGMSSGIYYLSVRAGNYVKIVKLMVNK